MKSKVLEETFRTIELQRKSIKNQLEGIENSQIWKKTSASAWSIGQWLAHLLKTIRLQRIGSTIYIPLAEPFASIFRNSPYETTIEDLFEKAPHQLPNPFWGIKSDKARKRPLEDLFGLLDQEKTKIQHLLENYEESILGHIKFYEGPFGFVNILQGVKLIAYHEKNDFRHINAIQDKL